MRKGKGKHRSFVEYGQKSHITTQKIQNIEETQFTHEILKEICIWNNLNGFSSFPNGYHIYKVSSRDPRLPQYTKNKNTLHDQVLCKLIVITYNTYCYYYVWSTNLTKQKWTFNKL